MDVVVTSAHHRRLVVWVARTVHHVEASRFVGTLYANDVIYLYCMICKSAASTDTLPRDLIWCWRCTHPNRVSKPHSLSCVAQIAEQIRKSYFILELSLKLQFWETLNFCALVKVKNIEFIYLEFLASNFKCWESLWHKIGYIISRKYINSFNRFLLCLHNMGNCSLKNTDTEDITSMTMIDDI